jgi:phenylacetate-coenzyme A ligase PaaK-like adenylate-forming protein
MKSLYDSIYLRSHPFLQNVALSLYGLRLNYIRHGGEYSNYFKAINKHLYFGHETLSDYINEILKTVVNEAIENVPYYRELFQTCGLAAKDIQTVEDIKKIPLLEKHLLHNEPYRFVNEKYDVSNLLCIHTTGTTGTPLKIFCDKNIRQLNYAYYDRFLSQSGINFKGKRATLGGRIILHQEQRNSPFWRYSYFQKNLLFSSYHLTDKNIPAYIDQLIKFSPDFIDTYPSSLYHIAKYAQDHDIDLKGVTRSITTSAETLFPEQRDVLESVFGVPVYDQYGAAEMCVFVGQCKEGSYHIHTDYGFLEFLREDGTNADPGEEAELVCTGFINPLMPLIRYRIGDRGIRSSKHCTCGSVFPVMEKIIGRMDDILVTPDGRRIGRLSPVVKGFPVKEVQYIQKVKESVEVHIVKDKGYTSETERQVLQELRKRLGDAISIKLNYESFIPPGKGGKLKSIISSVR